MKRKLMIVLGILFLSLLVVTNISGATKDKEELLEEVHILETEVENLKSDIDSLEAERESKKTEINDLSSEKNEVLDQKDLVSWFNHCNIFNVRGNVKVVAKYYNTFFGMETSSASVNGSGAIVEIDGNTCYVLSSYFITAPKSDYSYIKISVYDAFQTEYQATLRKSSKEYGLSILSFTKDKNDLYAIPLAKHEVSINEPVCNIYSLSNSSYNHMNFNLVDSYLIVKDYFSFGLMVNKIDQNSNIYGAMTVNMAGELCGLASLTGKNKAGEPICYSVPIEEIRTFLAA